MTEILVIGVWLSTARDRCELLHLETHCRALRAGITARRNNLNAKVGAYTKASTVRLNRAESKAKIVFTMSLEWICPVEIVVRPLEADTVAL